MKRDLHDEIAHWMLAVNRPISALEISQAINAERVTVIRALNRLEVLGRVRQSGTSEQVNSIGRRTRPCRLWIVA